MQNAGTETGPVSVQTFVRNKHLIRLSAALYLLMTVLWVVFSGQQWGWVFSAVSTVPLLFILLFMPQRKPVLFFYAALVSMPYLATAMTQVAMDNGGRAEATACLGVGLIYLALLRATLVALKQDT